VKYQRNVSFKATVGIDVNLEKKFSISAKFTDVSFNYKQSCFYFGMRILSFLKISLSLYAKHSSNYVDIC
jgi:hypothetical protein